MRKCRQTVWLIHICNFSIYIRYNVRFVECFLNFGIYQLAKFGLNNLRPFGAKYLFIYQILFKIGYWIFRTPFFKQVFRNIFCTRCFLMPAHTEGDTFHQNRAGAFAYLFGYRADVMINLEQIITINTATFHAITYCLINQTLAGILLWNRGW